MEDRLNFSQVTALVVDGGRHSSEIIGPILLGFGFSHCRSVNSVAAAEQLFESAATQLIITEVEFSRLTLACDAAEMRKTFGAVAPEAMH